MTTGFHKALEEFKTNERQFFPEIEAFDKGHLQVSKRHSMYYEQSGNPQGIPVILSPGGPGGGSSPSMRRFHNPAVWRIILFDMRGCGHSKSNDITIPGDVIDNTTPDLIADMEKLREHLKIDKWHLFGGSWGSTQSLAYAVTHPDRVLSMVLRGIFLLRQKELDFLYEHTGTANVFPEEFAKYRDFIPEEERGCMVSAYHKRLFPGGSSREMSDLTSQERETMIKAARLWSNWEGKSLFAVPSTFNEDEFVADTFCLQFARIENHYFYRYPESKLAPGFFPAENYLLEQASKLKNIPTTIVHGRYDMVTIMDSAVELKKQMPHAWFHVAPLSGHAGSDPGILSLLVASAEKHEKV